MALSWTCLRARAKESSKGTTILRARKGTPFSWRPVKYQQAKQLPSKPLVQVRYVARDRRRAYVIFPSSVCASADLRLYFTSCVGTVSNAVCVCTRMNMLGVYM